MAITRPTAPVTRKGWTVSVAFPADCALSEEERVLSRFALQRMFDRGTFFCSTIRDLRTLLHPEWKPDDRLDFYFHELHCTPLDELPRDVAQLLPSLVGRYLGIAVAHHPDPALPLLRGQ